MSEYDVEYPERHWKGVNRFVKRTASAKLVRAPASRREAYTFAPVAGRASG